MEKNKDDLRFIRTKTSILEAMISLLEKKSFDKITVKDICSYANISRGGFYLHYEDKYDLVSSYQKELMEKGTKIFKAAKNENQDFLAKEAVSFLKKEGKILGLLLSKNGSPEIQNTIKQLFQENARKRIIPYLHIPIKDQVNQKYLPIFLSNAVIGIVQEWLNTGQKESPEEMIDIIKQMINRFY